MRAGPLRHRVTISRATTSLDSYGEPIETWSDLATVWARVSPLTGREGEAARQIRADLTHRIDMRGNINSRPTPLDRLVHDGRTFEVVSVLDLDERGRELQITAIEKVTTS